MGAPEERWNALVSAVRYLPQRIPILWDRYCKGNPLHTRWALDMLRGGRHPVFVVMIERLGDIIACTPIAKHLKTRDPSLAIAWVCSSAYAEALEGNPYIDAVIHEESLASWLLSKRCLPSTATFHELFLDGQRCCWTGLRLLGRQSGITHHNYLASGRNLLLSYAQATGISDIEDVEPELYVTGSAPALPATLRQRPLMVIHFDSEDADRRLSLLAVEAFVRATQRKGWAIVELGLRPIAAGLSDEVHFLGSAVSLGEQILLLKSADYFAGVDSAFLHVANAYRVPATLFLGRFRHFDHFQTFSGKFLLSPPCVLLRPPLRPAEFPAELAATAVPDCQFTNRPEQTHA